MNDRIMIIDAQNFFLRSYIVDPSLGSNGNPVGGSKGFLKSLNKLVRDIEPTGIIVVWDGEGGSSRRRSVNKEYKSGRKPPRLNRYENNLTPEQIYENRIWQQVRLIEYLNMTPVIQFMYPGLEADDVIGKLVSIVDAEKVIVSSDKDFYQLLDDKTIQMRPAQKEIVNKKRIIENYNIHPNNFALARAIVGDSSDNLSGIKGVGLGTVAKRFPFLREERSVTRSELLNHCRKEIDSGSKLKVFKDVLVGESVIAENYEMMQLYSPKMSISVVDEIKRTLSDFEYEFNKTGMLKLMTKDGVGDANLQSLFQLFNKFVAVRAATR